MPKPHISGKRFTWEAISAIAGVVGVLVAALAYWAQVHGTQAAPPASPQQIEAQGTSQTPAEPSSRLLKDIVLHQHAGVDVDGAAAVVTPGLTGITGANDVYHDASPVSSSRLYTANGLYVYTGNPANAYSECTAYLADTTRTLDKYSTLDIGRSACFRTSDGHLALMQMKALDGSPGNYRAVTVDVRVWNN